jgi:prolyl oligopeptidase
MRNRTSRFFPVLVAVLLQSIAAAAQPADNDPFRYLEDRNDPRTQEFFRTQAASAAEQLAQIPGRAKLLARVRALTEQATVVTDVRLGGKRVFYMRQAPGLGQPVLCMREGLQGAERVLADPANFDQEPLKAAIDWFSPSPDGRHVVYGVSRGGDEASVLRIVVADGPRDLAVAIDRARFNQHLAWHPDGRSFYYSRIAPGGTGARTYASIRLYRHQLGRDAAKDEVIFAPGVGGARDVPDFAEPSLHIPQESRYAYAVVREGVRRELAIHVTEQRDLAQARPQWRKVAGFEDEVLALEGWKGDLYLLSRKGAPNHRVLRVAADATSLASARVLVPENDVVLRSMGLARDALYLRTMEGGNDRLERVPIGLLGRLRKPEFLRTPFDNAITELVTHPDQPGAILRLQGRIDAPRVMQVDAKSGDLRDTRLQPPIAADFSQMDEVRLYAPGHDGARIPVTLVYDKATRLTGENPTLLTGLGAYGAPLSSTFDPARLAWLERGGVYAVAHVRGGGEYGERWAQAGRGAAKANSILDFIAVADFLVRYGFTNPRRLAIVARGAGGILVGNAEVRRPELFAAVIAQAPLADLLRFEQSPSGPAQVPELGSAATREGAERLFAVSAYHQVREGTPYPATLLMAGMNDARVEPWQAAKMAARIAAASTSGKPVLLRVDAESGHGPGTTRSKRAEELTDIYGFALSQLGDPEFASARREPPATIAPEPEVGPAPQSAR